MDSRSAISAIRDRSWFYEFDLPDGTTTASYLPEEVRRIHPTRLAMLWDGLKPVVARTPWQELTVVDIACHQGFFSTHLARRGCRSVVAVDARAEHIADTALMGNAYGLANLKTVHADINTLDPASLGTFDVSLMLGLLYHIENPVGALRIARALTRRALVVETQVAPNMTGVVDWGSYQFQREIVGSLALIDETDVTDNAESSTSGVCIVPSYESLIWLLRAVGFARVERIAPPQGAYEQLRSGKRVMVVAHVD
jgi:tRNA (mo5U34)-methyltransferase